MAWALAFVVAGTLFGSPTFDEPLAKPGDMNIVTLDEHPGPRTSERRTTNPGLRRFRHSLLVFGALGGLLAGVAGARREQIGFALIDALAGGVAAFVIGLGGMAVLYVLVGLTSLAGVVIAAFLAGLVFGVIVENARRAPSFMRS